MQTVGNASSTHRSGRDAAQRVDGARRQVADLLNCSPGEIVFTSGATEANNLALRAAHSVGGTVITSTVEHPAVLETAKNLTANAPNALRLLTVDSDGLVDLDGLRAALSAGDVAIVSLMAANNETGVLTDLAPLADAAHAAGLSSTPTPRSWWADYLSTSPRSTWTCCPCRLTSSAARKGWGPSSSAAGPRSLTTR